MTTTILIWVYLTLFLSFKFGSFIAQLFPKLTIGQFLLFCLILFYFTIFVFFHWGQNIARTPIDTKVFLILVLSVWILAKNIT